MQQWIVRDQLYVVTCWGKRTLSMQGWTMRKYTFSGRRKKRLVMGPKMVLASAGRVEDTICYKEHTSWSPIIKRREKCSLIKENLLLYQIPF